MLFVQENCKGAGNLRKKREADLQREGDYIPDLIVVADRFVSNGPIHVEVKDSLLDFSPREDNQSCT